VIGVNRVEEPIDLKPIIKRKMIWDIIPCPDAAEIIEMLGLVPGSHGGQELEHAASHRRLNRLQPILEPLQLLSGVAGEVVGRTILEHQGIDIENDLDDTYLQHYIRTSVGTTVAVVANLVDYGVLCLGEGMVGERE